jgi:hypothetical protein
VNQGYYVSLDFQIPFKTGKKVYGYYTTNGTTVTNYLQTTYEVEKPGKTEPRSNESTHDLLRESRAKSQH